MKTSPLARLFFGSVVLAQLGAGECGGPPPILRDPGFDIWCGDQLCAWKVVRGDVERVGTWHESDSGVGFVGNDAAIQQLSLVNQVAGELCIQFDLVADVEDSAEVFLHVDVQGDGTVERSERIPTSDWQPLSFRLLVAAPFDGIRFELAKRGGGRAVLAQIQADRSKESCAGLPVIEAIARAPGSRCFGGDDCASGLCLTSPHNSFVQACAGCDPAASSCGGGETCGLGDPLNPTLDVPITCVPLASRETGESCLGDDECDTGICQDGTCSGCRGPDDCGGAACVAAWPGGPAVCAGQNPAGAVCGTDANCASGTCAGGERLECFDGRSCLTSEDCPDQDADGKQEACLPVGVQGGRCD